MADDRLVVAPRCGVFEPLALDPGLVVRRGQLIGWLRCGADVVPVRSTFDGIARRMLAWKDERVRQYQPLLWLHSGAAV